MTSAIASLTLNVGANVPVVASLFPTLHLPKLFSLTHHWAPIINDTWTSPSLFP